MRNGTSTLAGIIVGVTRVRRKRRDCERSGVLACKGSLLGWSGSTLGGETLGGTLGSAGMMCTLGVVRSGVCVCEFFGVSDGATATVCGCGAAGIWCTLGGAVGGDIGDCWAGCVVTLGGAVGSDIGDCWAGCVVCRVNISARCRSARSWSSAMGAKGAAG